MDVNLRPINTDSSLKPVASASLALSTGRNCVGRCRPNCAAERAVCSLTGNARYPFQAETNTGPCPLRYGSAAVGKEMREKCETMRPRKLSRSDTLTHLSSDDSP